MVHYEMAPTLVIHAYLCVKSMTLMLSFAELLMTRERKTLVH